MKLDEDYVYPVLTADLPAGLPYSPSNYLYEPLPNYPKDHYANRNRRPWPQEEVTKLILEEFGVDIIRPQQHYLLLKEYKPNKDGEKISSILIPAQSLEDRWHVGLIVAMGPLAFDHKYFPTGAPATFGDWVVYNRVDTLRVDTRKNGAYLFVQDKNVINFATYPLDLMSQ